MRQSGDEHVEFLVDAVLRHAQDIVGLRIGPAELLKDGRHAPQRNVDPGRQIGQAGHDVLTHGPRRHQDSRAARSEACSSAQRACSSTCTRSGSWLRTCQYAPVNGRALPASSTVGHGERKGTNAPNDSSTSAPQRLAMRGRTRCSQTRRPMKPLQVCARVQGLLPSSSPAAMRRQRGNQVRLGDQQTRVVGRDGG